MSDRDKNTQILALCPQITVLERQLGGEKARFSPKRPATGAAARPRELHLGISPHPRRTPRPGVTVAASTVWEILQEAGIDPAPERAASTWATFLASAHRAVRDSAHRGPFGAGHRHVEHDQQRIPD